MADNKLLPASGAGSVITTRTKDRTGIDTSIVALDLNPAGAESLMAGKMPITATGKWAALASASALTTELNALANGAYSGVGSAIDLTSSLYVFGWADIVLASLTPTTGAYIQLYLVLSLDGTTYEDPPSATNPGTHMLVATMTVTTGVGAKRIMTPGKEPFLLAPGKYKAVLYNTTGVALGATGNTVTLYFSNTTSV